MKQDFTSWCGQILQDPQNISLLKFGMSQDEDGLLWSSTFVTLVAKKYHESVTLPSGLRMVYDNH